MGVYPARRVCVLGAGIWTQRRPSASLAQVAATSPSPPGPEQMPRRAWMERKITHTHTHTNTATHTETGMYAGDKTVARVKHTFHLRTFTAYFMTSFLLLHAIKPQEKGQIGRADFAR